MIFIKPDGREIEVNERSKEYALELGWKLKNAEPVEEVQEVQKRRGRPPKVKDDNDSTANS